MQCLARFGVAQDETPDDDSAGSRRGAAAPAEGEDPATALPRPRRDKDDSADEVADTGTDIESGDLAGGTARASANAEQVNRLMAQLAAHEAQRPWGSQGARHLGFAGRPAVRAVVGGAAVLVVLLAGMWLLGLFV